MIFLYQLIKIVFINFYIIVKQNNFFEGKGFYITDPSIPKNTKLQNFEINITNIDTVKLSNSTDTIDNTMISSNSSNTSIK